MTPPSVQTRAGRGLLFIISGPSGVGKTVLCARMVERFSPSVVFSISATSRLPRGEEADGQEYFFYSRERFEREIAEDRFAEWALVHGNYYGTPKAFLDAQRDAQRHVLLNIDVQGALKICHHYPETVTIFIMPPSLEELEARIRHRRRDTDEEVRRRLENARAEISRNDQYRYIVVNDDLDRATAELTRIFTLSMQTAGVS
jgi:guanylate kinase